MRDVASPRLPGCFTPGAAPPLVPMAIPAPRLHQHLKARYGVGLA
jgi:hypothetical protein